MDLRELKEGDRVTFKAACRDHYRVATRKVKRITYHGPVVAYNGWADFQVGWLEVRGFSPCKP